MYRGGGEFIALVASGKEEARDTDDDSLLGDAVQGLGQGGGGEDVKMEDPYPGGARYVQAQQSGYQPMVVARRVYVGNLAWSTTSEELKAHFAGVGEVQHAEVLRKGTFVWRGRW